jgi:hypothetical protein
MGQLRFRRRQRRQWFAQEGRRNASRKEAKREVIEAGVRAWARIRERAGVSVEELGTAAIEERGGAMGIDETFWEREQLQLPELSTKGSGAEWCASSDRPMGRQCTSHRCSCFRRRVSFRDSRG